MNKLLITLFTGILLLFTTLLIAQTQTRVQLLNESTHQPIDNATFQYGNQSGISDMEGKIVFQFSEGITLKLSHLNFGQWNIESTEVQKAIASGVIYRIEEQQILQPVTVISLRPKMDEVQEMNFELKDKLAHDGGAILNQTPLINSIRKSGNYGFDPVLRGFKYDQLNIVIDGVQSCAAACPNRMDPATSQIAPNMMSSVEIIKGPHSLRYGSAFGGTINFLSSDMQFGNESDIYGRLSSAFESNGGILRSEGLIGFSGKRYDVSFFGSWSEGGDYVDGEGNTVLSSFSRASFGTNLGIKINETQNLSISATRNRARDTDFPALPMDLRTDDTWLFNASHKMTVNGDKLKSWNTSLYTTMVNHLMDNGLKNLDPRMMNAATDAETMSYGGRTEGQWMFGDNKLFAGIDTKFEEAQGTRARTFLLGPMAGNTVYDNAWQHALISKTGVFGEYHFKLGSIRSVFSGRIEWNDAQVKDATDGFIAVYPVTENQQLNPSFSLGGLKNFDKGLSLGLWMGRAVRSASMTERYINYFPVGLDPYEMLGNPDLLAEKNHQLDVTVAYKQRKGAIELSLFTSVLKDYISSEINPDLSPKIATSPGVRQFINLDDALLAGFELNWQQQLFAGLYQQFNLAYTYGKNQMNDEALPEIAPLDMRYSLSGQYLNDKLHPELTVRYVLEQSRISTSFGETETPAFALIDLGIHYQLTNALGISVSVNNILDEMYYEHLNRSVRGTPNAINAPGRNFSFSASLDLM